MSFLPQASSNPLMGTARLGSLEADLEMGSGYEMFIRDPTHDKKAKKQDGAEREDKAQTKPDKASANLGVQGREALWLVFPLELSDSALQLKLQLTTHSPSHALLAESLGTGCPRKDMTSKQGVLRS